MLPRERTLHWPPTPSHLTHSHAGIQAGKLEDCIVETSELEAVGMVGRDGVAWWHGGTGVI